MHCTRTRQAGYSIVELLVVLAIAGVIAAMALPSAERTLADVRMHNDARAIHSLLSLAKMRAASKYTRERLHCDFGNETYVLESFDKVTQTWVSEENPQALSANVDFDFNGLSDPPDDTQNTIHEALACKADDGVADIPNSGCIVFNSRGTPVNSVGDPDGDQAFYITDHNTGVYGVTVSATPLVRLWWSPANVKAWVHK